MFSEPLMMLSVIKVRTMIMTMTIEMKTKMKTKTKLIKTKTKDEDEDPGRVLTGRRREASHQEAATRHKAETLSPYHPP